MKHPILTDVKNYIRNPSEFGYPKILIMSDCTTLCADCAKSNFKSIVGAVFAGDRRDSWLPGGVDVFWEGAPFQCSNCSGVIESAYGDPDSEDE